MQKSLTFLHTSPVHIPTFDQLLADLAPDIPVRHLVDESLLHTARAAGSVTPQLAREVENIVQAASREAAVIVCTCSTLGGCAERVGTQTSNTVLRIDRAMAEQAIEVGSRIVVIAALAGTLEPTRQLLHEIAQAAGREIEIVEVVSPTAWAAFEAGDQARYLHDIATTIRQAAPRGDVIVLAQASMAQAAALCPDVKIPMLSSPRLGAEAAVAAYYNAVR